MKTYLACHLARLSVLLFYYFFIICGVFTGSFVTFFIILIFAVYLQGASATIEHVVLQEHSRKV